MITNSVNENDSLCIVFNVKSKKKRRSKVSAKKYEESLLIINFFNENDSLCIDLNVESKEQKKDQVWMIAFDNSFC